MERTDNKEPGAVALGSEKRHALLSASSSHRWLRCTPSARAEERYPDGGSEYAREGSLAHALGAKLLKEAWGLSPDGEDEEIKELGSYRSGELEEHAAGYADYVSVRYRESCEEARRKGGLKPALSVERRLDYSDWVEGGFGTGDAVIVGNGRIEVIDLKYGKGVAVRAEDNPQMKLYALGALDLYDYAYEIEEAVLTIYQPRLGSVSTWSVKTRDLLRWADEELRPMAKLAAAGRGVRSSGEWCRFCKAKGDCPRLAAESMELWTLNEDTGSLSADDLGELLKRIDTVGDWVSAVKQRALERALSGEGIPGWKVVEGRSVRMVTDAEQAARQLAAAGLSEGSIWKPRELRTIGELEKALGKKAFGAAMEGCLVKPPGKPALVAAGDKRKALNAADDFEGLL